MLKVDRINDLIVAVFRLNGRLIDAGNDLTRNLGLTSAWWQVLGALALSPAPQSVAGIARDMGLTRQGVQRVVDLLADEGLVRFADNPHHRRAKLVLLTERGAATYTKVMERQRPWALGIAEGLSAERIAAAAAVLNHIEQRLGDGTEVPDEGQAKPRRKAK